MGLQSAQPSLVEPLAGQQQVHAQRAAQSSDRHEQFGEGTILTMEGNGPDAKLTVYFDRAGSKKFIAKYAKLTRI